MQPLDDLTPNISTGYEDTDLNMYATQPTERTKEEQQAAAVTAASYPIMAEVAEWFHEQAQGAMDIANLNVESKVPLEAQVIAFQMYQNKMIEKAKEFEQWRAEA